MPPPEAKEVILELFGTTLTPFVPPLALLWHPVGSPAWAVSPMVAGKAAMWLAKFVSVGVERWSGLAHPGNLFLFRFEVLKIDRQGSPGPCDSPAHAGVVSDPAWLTRETHPFPDLSLSLIHI